MYVVVDSTEFYSNRLLEGVDIEIVNVHAQRANGAILIPQLVIDEAIKRQREMLRERYLALLKELQSFEQIYRHSDPEWSPPPLNVDIDAALASYKRDLSLRVTELGAVVLPYDRLALSPLMSRCLECKKPFDATGRKGFRDAVIWASVVDFLKSSPKACYLVTGNKNDFCGDTALHSDLQEDLRGANLAAGLVQVNESLRALAQALAGDKRPENIRFTAIRPQFGVFDVIEFVNENWWDIITIAATSTAHKEVFERVLGIELFENPSIGSASFKAADIRVSGVDRAVIEDCLLIRVKIGLSGDAEALVRKDQLLQVLRHPHHRLARLKAKRVVAYLPIEGTLELEVVANPKTGNVTDYKALRLEIEPDFMDPEWDLIP